MSNTLRKYDSSGKLAWSVEIENFTGKSVTDNDGNIYALLNKGVAKYSSAGEHILTQTSSQAMGPMSFYDGYTTDIAFGSVREDAPCLTLNSTRDRIYIVGGTGDFESWYPEAHYTVLDTDLNRIHSTRTYSSSDYLRDDIFIQVEVDDYGNAYMVGQLQQCIYKYDPMDYSWSYGWYPTWRNSAFVNSEVIPVITAVGNNAIYISGEAIYGEGSWISAFGPEYWDYNDFWCGWDGSAYTTVPSYNYQLRIELSVVGTWPVDLRPSKARVTISVVGTPITLVNANFTIDAKADYTYTETYGEVTKQNEFDIPFGIYLRELYVSPDIDRMDINVVSWPTENITGSTVDNIEFYIQPKQKGIFTISPAGEILALADAAYPEPTLASFLSRDTEIQQMLLTADGGIVAKEDDQNISLIDLTTGSSVWSYDTGMQVHSIIPGPDGLVSFEEADIGAMTLSSSPEISGTESQNVQPNGKIIFSQPTPEIDGYQITVTPLPGEITLQGDANIPAAINVSASSMNVSSNAGVVVPVAPPAGEAQLSGAAVAPTIDGHQTIIKPLGDVQFSGPLTAADISSHLTKLTPLAGSLQFTGIAPTIVGNLTILKPLGEVQFSADPEIVGAQTIIKAQGSVQFSSTPIAFQLGIEKSSGLAILNTPAAMTFSSDYVDINKQTIYADSGNLRFGGAVLVYGDDDRLAQVTAELPSFELDMFGGAFLQPELPMFEMDAIGFVGHNADLSLTFPSLSIENYAGGYVDATMPSFDLAMEATINMLAEISLTFPTLNFSISAKPFSEGDIDISLPGLQLAMEATAGIVGELSCRLPRLGMAGTLLAGVTGQLEGSFRIMDMSMVASPTGPGTISAEFPSLEMLIQSGAIESDVLRYNWERVR